MNTKVILTAFSVVFYSIASGEIVLGWSSFNDSGTTAPVNDNTPDVAAVGITGVIGTGALAQGGYDVTTWADSTDGTFGSAVSPAAGTTGGAVHLRINSDANRRLDVRITNNSGKNLRLNTLHFDYSRAWADSPTQLSVFNLDGNTDLVGNGFASVFNPVDLGPNSGLSAGDYTDVDADLTTLTDYILADGESAAFRFQASGGSSNNALWIDNIAFDATIIPEPATLTLISACGAGVVFIRRRFMI
jgi:hypothetical protein